MGKIGVYGSSFDPVTNVHLWTASTIAHRAKLDKVIFLPCANGRIDKQMKTSNEHRWEMLGLAIGGNRLFEVSDYEINERAGMSKQYTWYTMEYFKSRYPKDEVYFIMGADLLEDIDNQELPVHLRWKFREKLIANHKFIVMARDGIDMLKIISKSPLLRNYDDGNTFHLIDKGLSMEISSTYIRDELAMGGEPRYLLPDQCYQYIVDNKLYQKESNP
ncbi:nicotinate (nicotinamide) nucleotide adenylyltransferase [Peribacillus sp. CSMR9]|uniref:nicotinate (nicotinamide) nucleotide adenylyltransferase n=1 Tax=Peribacillus sp. CSMR9 TaxID=2981350 RepID=UPI0029542EBA|nr:nicotinate (nicotinamide) nucleotide adenylyltransferase [Peribacillus sp. CSMR9]MDV7766385.1 nicotinate (nicotinamide) nucleotide adenylyltransferase [Peribacillus sp. CSMR9]